MNNFKRIYNDYEPLYMQIANYIKNEIVSGSLKDNDKLPPEPVLANMINTSRTTLRKSLEYLENQNLIVKKKGAGTFVKNQESSFYRIAILGLQQEPNDMVSSAILSGLKQSLKDIKNEFIFLDDVVIDNDILRAFHNSKAHALVVGMPNLKTLKLLSQSCFDCIPMVIINAHKINNKNLLTVDGMQDPLSEAIQYLNDMGHKRIGYLTISNNTSNQNDRNQSFLRWVEKLNLEKDKNLFQDCDANHFQSGYLGSKNLLALENRPTAIICAGHSISMGAWQAIMEANLKIPEDISIIGFDIPLWCNPNFTTIMQPHIEIGEYAGKLIVDRMKKTNKLKSKTFPLTLDKRHSVKKI